MLPQININHFLKTFGAVLKISNENTIFTQYYFILQGVVTHKGFQMAG